MLQLLRNKAQSTVIQAIVVIIALVFIFWGVGSNLMNNREAALTVNDQEITFQDFQLAYDSAYENMAARFGGNLPKGMAETLNIKQQVINQLIQSELLRQGADEMGIIVSGEEIQSVINDMVQFQEGGIFSLDKYKALLASNKLSPSKYESNMRYSMLTEKAVRSIGGFASASSAFEVEELYRQDNEKVSVSYVAVSPDNFVADIEVDNEALKKWFEENSTNYNTEPEMKLKYMPFTYAKVGEKIPVDDAQIKKYYNENLEQFTTPEKRNARHILIMASETDSEELHAEKRKRAEEVQELAKASDDFAALAKEYSEGPSAANGGDLGLFSQGQMVPEFDQAVFSMQPGDISSVVKTQFGYHVIKLEEVQPAATQTLEQAGAEITSILRDKESKKLARQLATGAYEGIIGAGSLSAYADTNKDQELVTTDYFARSKAPAELTTDATFLDKAFSLKAGELSSIVESDRGFFIIFAEAVKAPETPPFEQVKEKATADYKATKAAEKASEIAVTILERINGGEPLNDVAKEYNLTTANSGLMGRNGQPATQFPPSLLETVFKLSSSEPFPESPGVVGDTHYVFSFQEREVPEIQDDTDLDRYKQMLLSAKQQEILGAYLANLEKKATITRHKSL
ncbi:SurA N-terminal domain-containing protein [Desulfopila sp. IMCC35008]|uniref:SurA N-terminal domain-containing protein n=1 Tax=Desulfopila sp. IMCC35008 TaxID=2653858 RepID=UPI0013D88135|nr:SurA N-terminal domain-containing protein [Desulfopila sp. IMCC35008]